MFIRICNFLGVYEANLIDDGQMAGPLLESPGYSCLEEHVELLVTRYVVYLWQIIQPKFQSRGPTLRGLYSSTFF